MIIDNNILLPSFRQKGRKKRERKGKENCISVLGKSIKKTTSTTFGHNFNFVALGRNRGTFQQFPLPPGKVKIFISQLSYGVWECGGAIS